MEISNVYVSKAAIWIQSNFDREIETNITDIVVVCFTTNKLAQVQSISQNTDPL